MAYTESQPYSVLSVNWSPNLAFDRPSHCSIRWKLLGGAVYGRLVAILVMHLLLYQNGSLGLSQCGTESCDDNSAIL